MGFLTAEQLSSLGLGSCGQHVLISDKASIYNPGNIFIGDHTRIDDFCILSAGTEGIHIGSHVHIACYVSLIGAERITVQDFAGISARTSVYSSNDDYSGQALTGPTIPEKYRKVTSAPVLVGRHVIVGAGSVILPGSVLEEGVAIGALSLVKGTLTAFSVYIGVPAKRIKERSRELLNLENLLKNDERSTGR